MLFLFKKKKVVVDCFTMYENHAKYTPIKPATKFMPEWWKNLPRETEVREENSNIIRYDSSMKRCAGFVDLYANSWVLPMWNELYLEAKPDHSYNWWYSANAPTIDSHPSHQHGGNFSDYVHLKIRSPWLLKEKDGVQFHFTNPFWNNINTMDRVFTADGVTNFKYQFATHVNMFVKPGIVHIESNQPMAMLTPMTERNVEFKTHVIDALEYQKLDTYSSNSHSYQGEYMKRKRAHEQMEQEGSLPECPFSKVLRKMK